MSASAIADGDEPRLVLVPASPPSDAMNTTTTPRPAASSHNSHCSARRSSTTSAMRTARAGMGSRDARHQPAPVALLGHRERDRVLLAAVVDAGQQRDLPTAPAVDRHVDDP